MSPKYKMELCKRSEVKPEENNLESVNIEEITEVLWKLGLQSRIWVFKC